MKSIPESCLLPLENPDLLDPALDLDSDEAVLDLEPLLPLLNDAIVSCSTSNIDTCAVFLLIALEVSSFLFAYSAILCSSSSSLASWRFLIHPASNILSRTFLSDSPLTNLHATFRSNSRCSSPSYASRTDRFSRLMNSPIVSLGSCTLCSKCKIFISTAWVLMNLSCSFSNIWLSLPAQHSFAELANFT